MSLYEPFGARTFDRRRAPVRAAMDIRDRSTKRRSRRHRAPFRVSGCRTCRATGGVDDSVSSAIESRHYVCRRSACEAYACQRPRMVRERHSASCAVLNDTEIGEPRVRLQNVLDRFESHMTDPLRSKRNRLVIDLMRPGGPPLRFRPTAAQLLWSGNDRAPPSGNRDPMRKPSV